MSGYVGKLFTAVSSALEFNTATLSGAIDIVVIEDDKGRRHCSPFHVRFGKLQLLKSRGIPVDIELNGQRTDLHMLLGAAGEAYFYNPRHVSSAHDNDPPPADVPPHISMTDRLESQAQQLALPVRAATMPLSGPAHQMRRGASDDVPPAQVEAVSVVQQKDKDSASADGTAAGPSDGAHPSDSHSTIQSHVMETTTTDYPFGYISDSEVELTRNERAGTNEVVDEPRSPPLFPSQRKWTSTVAQNPPAMHGSDNVEPKATRDEACGDDVVDPLSDQSSSLFGLPASPSSTSSGVVVVSNVKGEKGKHEYSPISTQEGPLVAVTENSAYPANEKITAEVPVSEQLKEVQGALTVSNSISDVVGEEDAKLECRSVDGYDADEDNVQNLQDQVAYVLSRPKALSLRQRRESETGTGTGNGVDVNAPGEQDEAAMLHVENEGQDILSRDGVLDMSLCGNLISPDMEEPQIVELFERHQVTYNEFSTNPTLLYDPSLLFRIDNRLVELRVAVPFIFSVLAFNERMDIDMLAQITATESKTEAPKSPPTPSRRFGWFGWASPAVVGEPLLKEEDLDVLDTANAADDGGESGEVQDGNAIGKPEEEKAVETASCESVDAEGKAEGIAKDSNDNLRWNELNADEENQDNAEKAGNNEAQTKDGKAQDSTARTETDPPASTPARAAISFSELDPDALSLRPTSEELRALNLKPGANTIRFVVESSSVELNCRIFLWSCHSKIVISDVDGTITRSDVLGHLLPAVGRDWSQVGVAGLYTQIEKNGYKVLYLTARPIGQASQTRAFLHSVTQGSAKLPNGPVLMSPNRLVESFTREVIRRKPHEFKIGALREVRCLFSPDYNPFHAGFGNRDTDVISYRAVGLIPQRIFVVNPKGELVVMKAKYESAASYITLQDLVESVFPDISGQGVLEKIQALTESATYNDWNYWKGSLPRVDIEELLRPK